MKCQDCKHWTESAHSKSLTYEGHPRTGDCEQLQRSDAVTIEVQAGWEGGYVSNIETDGDFFCAEFLPPPPTDEVKL
jgi:hypothetical protein